MKTMDPISRTIISLVALCLTLISSLGCATSSPVQSDQSLNTPLNVMSFNIRYGTARDGVNIWPNRRAAVVQLIRDYQPDLIGLQEALRFQLDELAEALPEYAEIGVGRDDAKQRGEYSAIFYRKSRFTVVEQSTFWLSDTPEIPGSKSWGNGITRICTYAKFTDQQNAYQPFYLFNTHFDHQSANARLQSAKLILTRIQQRADLTAPVILTGDFNAGEDSPPMQHLLKKRDDGTAAPLLDTYRQIHPTATNVGTFNGFKGTSDRGKIDYVLFEPGKFETITADIIRDSYHPIGQPAETRRYPSDHYPVWARLRFTK